MKWEILKGSKKDFEGAPAWATIAYKYGYSDAIRFCNGWNHGCKFSGITDVLTRQYDVTDLRKYKVIAERRPITEPVVNQQVTTEWDGEGLPPVGVECEIKYGRASNAEWIPFRCVGVDCGVAFGWAGNEAVVICKGSYEFRPIRSAEDVARDAVGLAVYHAVNWNAEGELASPSRMEDYKKVYEAIAAGNIPGVKLEGVK